MMSFFFPVRLKKSKILLSILIRIYYDILYSKDKNRKTGNTLKTIHLLEILFLIYLVDPASSHILVLKIKPCMSQFFDW